MKLAHRRALITGASRGLGLAIATAFVNEGAHVALCARTQSDVEGACAQLRSLAKPNQIVAGWPADVSIEADVDRWFTDATRTLGGVDILVGNAGVYGPLGPLEDADLDAWWKAVSINLLGNVLLLKRVIPLMKKQRSGKIIIVSGGGATQPLPNISAYAASKAGLVRLAETVAGEVLPFGIDVNCLAPGALRTRMVDNVVEAGPEKVGQEFYDRNCRMQASGEGAAPLELGASLALFLASAESDGVTGRLISAVWDPWQNIATYKEQLRDSDIYTLRRIVPKDRGQTWK